VHRSVIRISSYFLSSTDSRSFLTATYRSLLRTYILASSATPPQALLNLLSSPRIKHVDLSYIDDASGTTLLHVAAKRKDLRLIELAVRAGADVFVRDRKGRAVTEGGGKDDRVRVFLRQCGCSTSS
jgi:oxysterol-binding protein 1